MRPEDAAGKVRAASLRPCRRKGSGRAGSQAGFSLAPRPAGCCDHPVTPSNWGGRGGAGSVCRGRGSVLVPEPFRTGIPGVGGPGVGALPAWAHELLVAMPQTPTSLSALWGHEQELRVHLTFFQLLFLQKSDLLGVVLMRKASLPKSASQGQWGCIDPWKGADKIAFSCCSMILHQHSLSSQGLPTLG